MATIKKCDICSKVFDFGFSVFVNIQDQSYSDYTKNLKYIDEIGSIDICKECFFKMKKIAGEVKNAD